MAIISGGGSGGLPGVTVSGAAAASKALIATSGSAAGWAYPPGFEIGRATITSAALVTDTSEATATALITAGPFTFDGGAVVAEVYAPYIQSPSNAVGSPLTITLFEGSTEITRLAIVACQVNTQVVTAVLRASHIFTPSAASHTYKLCGFVPSTTGTPQVGAGAGGTGAYAPAYLRFVKV